MTVLTEDDPYYRKIEIDMIENENFEKKTDDEH